MLNSGSEISMQRLAGPVLRAGPTADQIVQAIKELNEDVQILERGSYVRVGAQKKCLLTKEKLDNLSGFAIQFPLDLEKVMVSFQGRLFIDESKAIWISDAEEEVYE